MFCNQLALESPYALAILYPGKVSLAVEPVVAVIANQVDALQKKGITILTLGNATGKQKAANYRRILQQPPNKSERVLAFCTPKYLLGTPRIFRYRKAV